MIHLATRHGVWSKNTIGGSKVSNKRRKTGFIQPTRECLLSKASSVSKRESPSFEVRDLAWEASTLPLSYTRPNRIYFNPKNHSCKGEVLASSRLATVKDRIKMAG